jgi:hypothetical protein
MSVVNERVHGYEYQYNPEDVVPAVEFVEISLEDIKKANKDIHRVLSPTIIQRRIDASTEIITQTLPLAQVGAVTSIALLGGIKAGSAEAATFHHNSQKTALVAPKTSVNPFVSPQLENKLILSQTNSNVLKAKVEAAPLRTAATVKSQDYQSEPLTGGQNIWNDVAAVERIGKSSKGQVAEVVATERASGVDKIAAKRHESIEDAAQHLPDGFWVKMPVIKSSALSIKVEHKIVVEPGECASVEAEQHDETLATFIEQNPQLKNNPNLIDAYSEVNVDGIGSDAASTTIDSGSGTLARTTVKAVKTSKAVPSTGGASLSTIVTKAKATTKATAIAAPNTTAASPTISAPSTTTPEAPIVTNAAPASSEATPVAPIDPTKSFNEKSSVRGGKDHEKHEDHIHHHHNRDHKSKKHEHHHEHRHLSSTSTKKIVLNVSSRVGNGISKEGQHSLQEAVAEAGKKADVSPNLIASFYYAENERRDDTNTDASSASIAVAGDGIWRDPAAPFGHGASWNSNIYTAAGPWQFITSTWNEYKMPGMNDTSSRNNLDAAALVAGRYLHSLLRAAGTTDFDHPGPGKILYAGYGYNHSNIYAQSILNTYNYISQFRKVVVIKHRKDAYVKSGAVTKFPSSPSSTQPAAKSSYVKHHDIHDHQPKREHKKKHHHEKHGDANKLSSTMIGQLIVKDAYRYNGASYEEDSIGQNYGSIWHTWFHAESNGNYGSNAKVDCVGMASNNVLWDLFNQDVDNNTWSLYPNNMYKEVPFSQVKPGYLIEPEQYGAQAWKHPGGHVEIVTGISGDNIYTFGAHDNDVAQPDQVDDASYNEASDPENMFLEYVGPHKLTPEGRMLLKQIKNGEELHSGQPGVVKLSSTGPTKSNAAATSTSTAHLSMTAKHHHHTSTAHHHNQSKKGDGEVHKHDLDLAHHAAIHAVKHSAEKTLETAKHDDKNAAARARVKSLHASHAVARKRLQVTPVQDHHAARQHITNINQRLGHHSIKGLQLETK